VGVVLTALGVVGIAGSFAWKSVAEPRLVKYPTDVDETPAYSGTVKIFLDPSTYAPLDPPIEAPLTVSRHIEALGSESSDSLVVIAETIDLDAEGQFGGQLKSQYVMDRTEIYNVKDDRAWAFTPDNVVDRSPAFRLAFPFDTPAVATLIYKNEVGTTYLANPLGEGEVGGLSVINFAAEQTTPLPVSPAYLAALNALNPLPSSLTLDQLKPILKGVGIDIDVLLPALLPNLTPEDTAALVDLAAKPIQLEYLFTFAGADSVEPSTGSIVEVRDVVETLYASPDPAVLDTLRQVLGRYPAVPAAVDALAGLERLAASPTKVFQNEFSQTPESVADVVNTVKDAKSMKQLAQTTIPNSLLIGGIVLAVIGLLLVLLGRRRGRKPEQVAPVARPATQSSVTLVPGETITITDPSPASAPPPPEPPPPAS
jgi:hypothetical protein